MPLNRKKEFVKSVIKIEDWQVVPWPAASCKPIERPMRCLNGKVQAHPQHSSGGIVVTSPIIGRCGNLIITKSGNVYELGKAFAEYTAQVSNVEKLLLLTLPEIRLAETVDNGKRSTNGLV